MSKTIWKFEIETTDEQVVQMPEGAKILTVAVQLGTPCIWALVDPSKEKENVVLNVFGTGHPIDYAARDYIGTYPLQGGNLIFHVFKKL